MIKIEGEFMAIDAVSLTKKYQSAAVRFELQEETDTLWLIMEEIGFNFPVKRSEDLGEMLNQFHSIYTEVWLYKAGGIVFA
jgi:hypothetical protein